MPDGTVCNPAYLPEYRESLILARAFVGNGYAALSSADQLVNKPITREYLQTLFAKKNSTAVEANIGLSFTTKYFQAAFSPYRMQYASEIHNPNNPVVSVHAAIERAFVFSTGSSLIGMEPKLRDFAVGMKVRYVERKFVHGSFSFIDVGTREPRDYLPSQKQTAILANPVLAWVPGGNPWHLRTSIGAKNLGFSSAEYNEYPNAPDLEAGVGIEPPLGFGRFRLGLDFADLLGAPSFEDRLRFGVSYQFGVLELMAGANSASLTTGISFLLSFLQAGVSYEVARDDLENGKEETRIATEISVRF
jgi:hypothetical protein